MKRKIAIGLTALTILGLVGCGKQENITNNESVTPENKQEESLNNQTQYADTETFTGKISDIIGNQLTVKLIAGDFELTDEMKEALGIIELSESEIKQLESGETIQTSDGGTLGMTSVGGAEELSSEKFNVE